MKESIELSIIVCTYNRDRYLPDTLRTLAEQSLDAGEYEVILVDNNSTDRTQLVCREYQLRYPDVCIRYVFEGTQGLSVARNRGAREAAGGVVAFVDDDIMADSAYAETVLDFFRRTGEAVAAGGRIVVHFDAPRPEWMSPFLMPLLGQHHLGERLQPYPRNKYPLGGNMSVRRELFSQVGGFSERLGRSGERLYASEEKEFFGRVRNQGRIYYLPDAVIRHRVDAKRLETGFIRRQATGIGMSERIRILESGAAATTLKIFEELIKSAATLVLALTYTVTFRTAMGSMLIKFRYWVIRGMLGIDH